MIFGGVYWIYKFERTKTKMSNFIKNVRYMTIENSKGEIKPVEYRQFNWGNVGYTILFVAIVSAYLWVWCA